MVAFDDEGRYVYANRAALRLYRVPQLVGRSVGEFVTEWASEGLAEGLAALHASGEMSGESELRRPDGRPLRIRYHVATYLPHVHVSVFTALAEAPAPRARLYHGVFESSPEATLLLDDHRNAIDGNRAARRFLGLSREDLSGRSLDEFIREDVRARLDRMWDLLRTRRSLRGSLPMELSNGLQRTVSFLALAGVAPGSHVVTFRGNGDNRTSELVVEDGEPVRSLTAREREVMTLLARGATAEAIAGHAELSPETVRTHARNARQKLGAKTRAHAIALAIVVGEIEP